jgi:hypothetical protein
LLPQSAITCSNGLATRLTPPSIKKPYNSTLILSPVYCWCYFRQLNDAEQDIRDGLKRALSAAKVIIMVDDDQVIIKLARKLGVECTSFEDLRIRSNTPDGARLLGKALKSCCSSNLPLQIKIENAVKNKGGKRFIPPYEVPGKHTCAPV